MMDNTDFDYFDMEESEAMEELNGAAALEESEVKNNGTETFGHWGKRKR
jgi:hypothetical protein